MKLSRKQMREILFLLLFGKEFHASDEMKDQGDLFFERLPELPESFLTSMKLTHPGNLFQEDREYIENKLNRILADLDEIDRTISEISEGWRLNRLGKVELTILRLAVFEIQKDPDIPTGVAINEAVVLSKRYSGEESSRFVNGVLAKLA